MRRVSSYKCPHCIRSYETLGGWSSHIETLHPDTIPKDYSLSRYFYFILTGKTHGTCIQCKRPTKWNEVTMKYDRFCGRMECKNEYVELCNKRIIGKYGKTEKITINKNGKAHLLNNPDQQRTMASNRSISGKYKFQDGREIGYVGSYELNFLTMIDTFFNFDSSDIISPSPHHYYYTYKNPADKEHEGIKFYIPDFYIPSLNLEIEIKENTNNHPKIIAVDKVKERLKDELMSTITSVNYIKIVENDYSIFFEYFLQLKESIPNDEKILTLNTLKTTSAIESFSNKDKINNNTNIEIRKVDKSDFEDIVNLFNRLSDKDKKYLAMEQKIQLIKKNIKDAKHCFVATIDGKIVGFMRESGRPEGFILLEELVVDPEYRNKKIASKMLEYFHTLYPKTLAKTKVNNEIMNGFLTKNGYNADNLNSKSVINWTRNEK